jgi:cytochrome c
MSSFEFNKLAAGVLVALIVWMVTGIVAEELVPSEKPAKDAYTIAEAAAPAAAPEGAAPAASEKPAPIPADLLAKADATAGEAIAKKCAACHTFDKGGPNRVGPNLYGVIGRPRASVDGFTYSDAVKKLGGNWQPQDIAAFIFNPKAYAPGTKMGFAGLPKPEDRANVLAFLNKQSDKPVDLSAAQ